MRMGLLEIGQVLLIASRNRLDTVSDNVANATTPGYRRRASFEGALGAPIAEAATDFTPGPLTATSRTFDLAIAGEGFFAVRTPERVLLTRAGQFERDAEGRLIDSHGFALQTTDGHDLIVTASDVEIANDGTVVENGAPTARIALLRPSPDASLAPLGGVYFVADSAGLEDAPEPLIRQGMLEGANIELAAEMIGMMSALRGAELGARVVQAYDTLIGQTITTFGRGQR